MLGRVEHEKSFITSGPGFFHAVAQVKMSLVRKPGLQGFRPGHTQTRLYNHR